MDEVSQAAIHAGRSPQSVCVIGVSKYVDAEVTLALHDIGCGDLGESRPQKLFDKFAASQAAHPAAPEVSTRDAPRWHMIGSLQRNKAKRVVEIADVIHSIDSPRLLQSVSEYAIQLNRTPRILIEVNISGEQDKHGFTSDDLLGQWPELIRIAQVPIVGLMGMAGLDANQEAVREQFASLRLLRDTITSRFGTALPELSMGMSGDFAEAIQEGATMVRIGSRLFEGII
jgi:PLP dependent protein